MIKFTEKKTMETVHRLDLEIKDWKRYPVVIVTERDVGLMASSDGRRDIDS